jgi:hypothetical protein
LEIVIIQANDGNIGKASNLARRTTDTAPNVKHAHARAK